jgi:hypothetical protein
MGYLQNWSRRWSCSAQLMRWSHLMSGRLWPERLGFGIKIYRPFGREPKPRAPEGDPVVPKEFLARYQALKDNRFQVGMLVRAYLRLHERIPQAPIRESDLWGTFSAEYKAKYGHKPSRASRTNFSRLQRQVGLPVRESGRPKTRK